MMTKVTFVNFFIKTCSILSIQYMYKISCKMDRIFWDTACLFTADLLAPSLPPVRFWKNPSSGRVKILIITLCYSKKGSLTKMTTRYHLLSLVVAIIVTRCHSFYHSLSIFVTHYCLLSLVVALAITRTTRAPLVCLFVNDHPVSGKIFKAIFWNIN